MRACEEWDHLFRGIETKRAFIESRVAEPSAHASPLDFGPALPGFKGTAPFVTIASFLQNDAH